MMVIFEVFGSLHINVGQCASHACLAWIWSRSNRCSNNHTLCKKEGQHIFFLSQANNLNQPLTMNSRPHGETYFVRESAKRYYTRVRTRKTTVIKSIIYHMHLHTWTQNLARFISSHQIYIQRGTSQYQLKFHFLEIEHPLELSVDAIGYLHVTARPKSGMLLETRIFYRPTTQKTPQARIYAQ